MRGSSNDAKITREEGDLASLLSMLPGNPVPWAAIIRLLAPIVARLAVRYALKRVKRGMAEDKVNAIGRRVGAFVSDIIEKRTKVEGDQGKTGG